MAELTVKFYEVFKEEEKEIKQFLDKKIIASFTPKTIQEEGDLVPPAALISIRTQSQIPEAWAEKLSGILSRSQGFDHLQQYRQATRTQTALGYLATYCSRAVAEHAIMAMMFLMRKTRKQLMQFVSFQRDHLTGNLIQGKRALVVGVGNIGREIALLAHVLGMEVRGVDLNPLFNDIEYTSLHEGVAWAEIVFCALPLTSQTNHLLDYSLLGQTQKGVFFINISRGEISPLEDLEKLMDEEKIRGLALDVFENEKDIAHALRNHETGVTQQTVLSRLSERENVLFTPHNAFNTEESLLEKSRLTAESIKSFLETGTFCFPVPR